MSRTIARLVFAGGLAVAVAAGAQQPAPQQDPKEMALSWQKKANDTRAIVIGVAEELGRIGDQGNAAAKGMIDDAHRWVAEGDKSRAQADEKMAQEAFEKASYDYNMAWQHYVRAATSRLNARRILTGK